MPNNKPYIKGSHADTIPNEWNRKGSLWWAKYRRRLEHLRQVWHDFGWDKSETILACGSCGSANLVGVNVCDGEDNKSRFCCDCRADHYLGEGLVEKET